jgi:hypothetical protein
LALGWLRYDQSNEAYAEGTMQLDRKIQVIGSLMIGNGLLIFFTPPYDSLVNTVLGICWMVGGFRIFFKKKLARVVALMFTLIGTCYFTLLVSLQFFGLIQMVGCDLSLSAMMLNIAQFAMVIVQCLVSFFAYRLLKGEGEEVGIILKSKSKYYL